MHVLLGLKGFKTQPSRGRNPAWNSSPNLADVAFAWNPTATLLFFLLLDSYKTWLDHSSKGLDLDDPILIACLVSQHRIPGIYIQQPASYNTIVQLPPVLMARRSGSNESLMGCKSHYTPTSFSLVLLYFPCRLLIHFSFFTFSIYVFTGVPGSRPTSPAVTKEL